MTMLCRAASGELWCGGGLQRVDYGTHDFVDMLDLRVGGDVAVVFEKIACLA